MKTDLFQSCGHCWVFQICWHTECSTLTASSSRIWNSSTGIPSPLALYRVILPKAHLTSHSRMSDSRWVITPSWSSGLWRYFLYCSMYSCHLFLISSASVILLYLLLLFFSQLLVRTTQTTILPFCISFSWRSFGSLPPVQCYKPLSIVLQVLLSMRSNPLNLFLTSTV